MLAIVAAFGGYSQSHDARAQDRQPLLMEGKQTLLQRVLTRPQAKLLAQPGDGALVETLPAFEMFYVYDRRSENGENFVEVGRTLSQGPEGWISEARTIEWRQAIVVGFNNPANRERALIFRSREALEDALSGEDVVAHLSHLREQARDGNVPVDGAVVSIEPENFIDIENNFYVLPILEASSVRLPTRMPARLLKIASLSQTEGADKPPVSNSEDLLRDYKVGLVFAIDTTRSMRPYIDEVRNAVSELKDRLASHPESERFRFGLFGFRDNVDLAPGLEYVTKSFLSLSDEATADRFLAAIDTMDVSTSNSVGFNEDSVAGVMAALNETDWNAFGGRFVILITDAAPRQPGPEAAHGMLAVPEVQRHAQEVKNAAIYTMHLKTPAGGFDHEAGAAAYQQLSQYRGQQLYFGIADGDAAAFREQIDRLASALTGQVTAAMSGLLADADTNDSGSIENNTQLVGRAMQLAYLGRASGAQPPEIIEGWLTDRDPVNRSAFPIEPYVMMTRNELSTLRDVMMTAIQLGRDPDISEDGNFFSLLREQAALISRSPDFVRDAGTLGDVLGEYLEDLPYVSNALSITEDSWRDLGPIGERNLIDSLESKVEILARIHDTASRWTAPSPSAPDGEYLTIVPLSLMP